jgi:uncharacterized protein (DUF4415 family)
MLKMQESITGLIQVACLHNEHLDQNHRAIAALAEQGKGQQERINALIRIVEGHVSNHP